MVVNISVKFRKIISNGFKVTAWKKLCDRQPDVHDKNNMSPEPEVERDNV